MPVFSGQQTTHLQQRAAVGYTTQMLRTASSVEYSPAPNSGNGTSTMPSDHLPSAPNLDRITQAPRSYQQQQQQQQHQQHHHHHQSHSSSSSSVGSGTQRMNIGGSANTNTNTHTHTNRNPTGTSLLSPHHHARRTVQNLPLNEAHEYVLPLSYDSSGRTGNGSGHHYHSDQAPQKPRRSTVVRAAESGRGTLLPVRHTQSKGGGGGSHSPTTPQRQHQHQRQAGVSPKRNGVGRSKSYSQSTSHDAQRLPRTRHDLASDNDNHSTASGRMSSKLAYLRRRTAGNVSSDDEFDAMGSSTSNNNNNNNNNSGDSLFHVRAGRRKQQGSSVSLNSMGSNNYNNHNHNHSREHPGPNHPGVMCQKQLIKLSRMKLGHLLQVVIVLAVIGLVYESHHKALFATQQLTQFKDEESLLLLHLQKIEQQSIQLHENLGRLAQAHIDNNNNINNNGMNNNNNNNNDNNNRNDADDVTGSDREVDFDLIHKQTQQLYQMEEELSREVSTLQKRIQLSARNHIIQEFGEGPVQVVLELDFGNENHKNVKNKNNKNNKNNDNTGAASVHKISILLWHDTPHAAWTWLEQIGNHVWDGAEFHWQQGNIIETLPNHRGGDDDDIGTDDNESNGSGSGSNGSIEFVEQSQHAHQAWTVGIREHPIRTRDGASGKSSLGMYINLQDNSKLHTHETCVGKIIDGFDSLQKLLEATRSQQHKSGNADGSGSSNEAGSTNDEASSSSVVIRRATAMHYVTKKAGMG